MHVPADSDLSLVGDDVVPIGEDPASHRSKPPSGKSKPGSGKKPGASPSPVPTHDSDVRLIADGSDLDFQLEVDDKGQPASPKSPSPKKRPSQLAPGKPDSGVRIVPLDQASDSDVKIVQDDRPDADVLLGGGKTKSPSDSDVRLETVAPPPGRGHDPFVTEEIELDLEALKEEEAKAKRRKPTKSTPELPTISPFELSEDDADAKPARSKKKPGKNDDEDSSDFELKPIGPGDESPIDLGSDELPIPLAKDDDDDAILGDISAPGKHKSGINLRDPRDSGISLEEGGDSSEEIEFLPTGGATATPKPGPSTPKPTPGHDSSGEFELSMDDSPVGEDDGQTSSEFELSLDPGTGEEDSSSEFELSLDAGATTESPSAVSLEEGGEDSDSEFELSLDASGELESEEASLSEDDKDIFETDFEVPALDDESGSEAVALDESDTDLEDSDFELDLSDEDLAAEEDSGSQVVALEDEEGGEVDSGSDEEMPVSRKPRKKAPSSADEEDSDAPLIDLDDMEGEARKRRSTRAKRRRSVRPQAPSRAGRGAQSRRHSWCRRSWCCCSWSS